MPYVSNSGSSKKPKKPSGISGFLGNLVDDVQETATGLVPGLVHIGSSVAHDAGKAVGLTSGQYRTDDILSAIRKSYTDKGTFWGELGRISLLNPTQIDDRLRGAGRALYNNPLGPILDGAALLTGGGALAGKIGQLSGKAQGVSRVKATDVAGFDRTLSRNPVIATRQRGFDALSNRYTKAPVAGAQARTAKNLRRTESHKLARENAQTLGPMRRALTGLDKWERKAVTIAAGGHRVDDMLAMMQKRREGVGAEIQRKKETGDRGDTTIAVKGDRAKRVGTDEDLAYEDAGLDALLDADRRDSLKVNQRNLARIEKRIGELEQVRKRGILESPKPKVQQAVEAARALTAITTKRMVDEGLDDGSALARMSLESQILRTAGVVDAPYQGAIRSHIMLRPEKLDVGRGGQKWTPGQKGGEWQKNTGYNFWNARDDLNPAMYIHSARQVFEYRARLNRFETLLANAEKIPLDEAALAEANGYKVIKPTSTIRKQIDDVYRVLVDAESALQGTEGYAKLRGLIEDSLRVGDDVQEVSVVPAKFYDELVGEFTKSSEFVRRFIDTPTRVWRALTLNMRPAWIVNNFIGQMFLLGVSHGGRGMKAYFEQFGKKGKLADELAPELVDFGWAHESMADLAGLGGNKVTRGMRRISDAMGNLNAKLTDSHTRKAAWIAEMKPHIARLQKADPDLSYEDAAKSLWQNEKFADEITQRVLDDMIDFSDLSQFERRFVKRAIPFWSWIKGISKRTGRLVMDDPLKAAAGVQIGQVGQDAVRERYGDVPHFLQGVVDAPDALTGKDGVLTTQGLNPFMTPGDVVAMISGTALPGRQDGPQNPLAQVNPLFKAPAEALSNRDFFYGRDLDPRGVERSLLQRLLTDVQRDKDGNVELKPGGQVLNSFAQWRLIKEYQQAQDAKKGMDYAPLYQPSMRDAVLQYLGIPVRQMDAAEARRRAAEA